MSKKVQVNNILYEIITDGYDFPTGILINPIEINEAIKKNDYSIEEYVKALKLLIERYSDLKAIYEARDYDPTDEYWNIHYHQDGIDSCVSASNQTSWNISIEEKDGFLDKVKHGTLMIDKIKRREEQIARSMAKKNGVILPSRSPKSGYVYLIKASTGHRKIGRTVNPQNRMKTFNIKLPFEVEYEHLIKTNDMLMLESQLHNKFSEKRINGEWFDLDGSDVEYIKSLVGD